MQWQRRGLRHQALHLAAGQAQLFQMLLQPVEPAGTDPDRLADGGIRLQRAVQYLHIVQHQLFQQAVQHQPRACWRGQAALGQLQRMPGQRLHRHDADHLVRIGQRQGIGSGHAMLRHTLTIGAQGKRVAIGCIVAGQGESDKQLGHGAVRF